ncbi:hypothetical protein RHMOL_Rhmol06G0324100 [Rhododendron molle]|uniref:Uncharacterized protein n=1 Tax=Rhododendron molle TaxID=49168 RepID=A0ACC0NJ13_RHOML|nr:hypothetical protein RHMOL_Rhmol06G0324100 [Rhododendron molle]
MGGSATLVLCASLAFYYYVSLLALVEIVRAQNQTGTTPASEVSALNSVFSQWGISATNSKTKWNISGEPCTGAAIDSTSIETNNGDYNPGIRCECNGTVCHITHLKVYALDVAGGIPDELWSLTSLSNLNLGQNYLTGPLSSSIANLTQMQYLSLGINSLSGEVPKALGNLTNLIVLSFSSNYFSGPLPSELGKLTKLEQLYIDSSGVSGAIPSTYAALQNMKNLRFQGNSFEGPIPPSFSNLTNLTSLMISDLSNGSSTSLEFLKDMMSLNTLILRNNNISGSIPSNIGDYQSLSLLDLSFNNLAGRIPDSLFNLSSLSYLFLGNNKLNETLPAQKSTSLRNIDVSYNELSGSLPSWIEQGLQLNLVANNFTIESADNRFISTLNFCKQLNEVHRFLEFIIQCSCVMQIQHAIIFNIHSSSVYSVLPSGLNCLQRNFPCRRNSPIYSSFAIKCGGPQITASDQIVYESDNETLDAASYNVTSTNRWAVSNVGRFINANNPKYESYFSQQFPNTLDSEMFRTARISPGSLRYYGLGLQNGNYNVTLQFAEIVIENPSSWKSLGRRVFDIYIQGNRVFVDFDIKKEAGGVSYQPVERKFTTQVSENYLEIHLFWAGKGTCCIPAQGTYGPSISAISAVPADFTPNVSNNPPSSATSKKSATGLIVGIVVPVGVVSFLSVLALCCFIKRRKRPGWDDDEDLLGMDARPYTFSYAELKTATEDFNPANKLGEGGFGPVFKGTLNDGRVIAVKQLSVASHQGKSQFIAEIATISAVQHRNLVKFGYLAPEYAMRGHLTEKADVFGFGVVALEIVSGRLNSDSNLEKEKIYLLEWAWHLHENDCEVELVDANLLEFDEEEVKRVIGVALLCTQTSPQLRPSMSRVVAMLSGDIEVSVVTTRPGYLTDWKFNDTTSFMTTDTPSGEDKHSQFSSSSATMTADRGHSPINAAHQVEEVIGEETVAMLSGDIEVSTVTTRPGYLTDWKFNDTTSFMTTDTPSGENKHSQFSSSSATTAADPGHSPINAPHQMEEVIGEAREGPFFARSSYFDPSILRRNQREHLILHLANAPDAPLPDNFDSSTPPSSDTSAASCFFASSFDTILRRSPYFPVSFYSPATPHGDGVGKSLASIAGGCCRRWRQENHRDLNRRSREREMTFAASLSSFSLSLSSGNDRLKWNTCMLGIFGTRVHIRTGTTTKSLDGLIAR